MYIDSFFYLGGFVSRYSREKSDPTFWWWWSSETFWSTLSSRSSLFELSVCVITFFRMNWRFQHWLPENFIRRKTFFLGLHGLLSSMQKSCSSMCTSVPVLILHNMALELFILESFLLKTAFPRVGRVSEAKDAARVALKSPWWTLGCPYQVTSSLGYFTCSFIYASSMCYSKLFTLSVRCVMQWCFCVGRHNLVVC